MKTAILIGDSIRRGYEPFVKAQLSGLVDVWGPDANCGPSTRILDHLQEWVIARRPDIVHINCGLHDMAREAGNPPGELNRVPVTDYRRNVRAILQRIAKETSAKIVWALTTPVLQDRQHARNTKTFRSSAEVSNYNDEASTIARELGIPVHDLHRVVTDGGAERLLLEDGVHFTPEGYEVLGKAVTEAIRKLT